MNAQVAQASPLTSPRVGNETQQRGRFDLRSVREEDADAVRKLFWEALVVGPDAGPAEGRRMALTDRIALGCYAGVGLGIGMLALPSASIPAPIFLALANTRMASVVVLRAVGALLGLVAPAVLLIRVEMIRRFFEGHVRKSWQADLGDVCGYYMVGKNQTEGDVGDDGGRVGEGSSWARKARKFWVAEAADSGGKIVGCLGLDVDARDPTKGVLRRMAVASTHRRMGIGRALILAAVERARKVGVKDLLVVTSVYNQGGMGIYERVGFREDESGRGRRMERIGWGCRLEEIDYWLKI